MDDTKLLQASILIVDDLEFNINLLHRVLMNAGYTSISSTSQPQTVSTLQRENNYDLILLDIEMPEMDGFQVMQRLKKTAGDDCPPILVITAAPEHKLQALQCGAKDFVSKPFEQVEVLTRVHNMLEARLLQKESDDHKDDNPALSSVIQRNIRKIIRIRQKASQDQSFQDRIAHAMTSFSGSMNFFYVHILWFSFWFLLNTGNLGVRVFDPYPYGFLTMVVSLEAIFLATFVLISQNLLARGAERLTDLGLQTSLLTEHELTRVLQLLRSIQIKLGIANDEFNNQADADLTMETKPEDVLAEIERLHRREAFSTRRGRKLR